MPATQTLAAGLRRWTIFSAFWRPVGVIYLLVCLGGLGAGLWPDVIYPSSPDFHTAPLPVLQTLAVTQVGFFLLIYPIILFRRNLRQSEIVSYVVETIGLFLAAAPFYVAAGWMSDATGLDCLRTALAVAVMCPLGWITGRLLARPVVRSAVLAGLLAITIGLPGLYYIFRDFLETLPAEWIWYLSPATFAWSAAAGRNPSLLPEPIWAFLIWPSLAAAGALIRAIAAPRNDERDRRGCY